MDEEQIDRQAHELYELASSLGRELGSGERWYERANRFVSTAKQKLPPACERWDGSFVTATCYYLLQVGVPYETVKLAIIFHFSE